MPRPGVGEIEARDTCVHGGYAVRPLRVQWRSHCPVGGTALRCHRICLDFGLCCYVRLMRHPATILPIDLLTHSSQGFFSNKTIETSLTTSLWPNTTPHHAVATALQMLDAANHHGFPVGRQHWHQQQPIHGVLQSGNRCCTDSQAWNKPFTPRAGTRRHPARRSAQRRHCRPALQLQL